MEPDLPQTRLLVPTDCCLLMPEPSQVSCIKKQQFIVKLPKHNSKKNQNWNPSPFLVLSLWKELRCAKLPEHQQLPQDSGSTNRRQGSPTLAVSRSFCRASPCPPQHLPGWVKCADWCLTCLAFLLASSFAMVGVSFCAKPKKTQCPGRDGGDAAFGGFYSNGQLLI